MNYRLVKTAVGNYLECLPDGGRIENENDALDLVAACGENETHRLMIHAGNLTRDFYDLKTRLAGDILLKFTNYYLKVATVLTPELVNQGRFREMVLETNRTNSDFRVFYDREAAEKWLLD